MCNPSKFINENCPECNPRDYAKTLCEFTGKVEKVDNLNNDGSIEISYEYLYQCCTCDALMWVEESWAKEHAVESPHREEVVELTFDSITKEAFELEDEKQAKMLFYLLGNLNGYFKFDFDNKKTLNKEQAISLANDALEAVT